MKKIFLLSIVTLVFVGCLVDPKTDDTLLDGAVIQDPSLSNNPALIPNLYLKDSSEYLLSTWKPIPTEEEKQSPVIIAVHGFSASTYEWHQFRAFADTTTGPNALVSLVLMGGHGRDYTAFKNATWEDWKKPIVDEYQKLTTLGYTNISFAGSSTGGALLLNEIEGGRINGSNVNQYFLIDPIVVPGDKLLTLIDIVGPVLGNDVSTQKDEKKAGWYSSRPEEALNQLVDIIGIVRDKVEDGFSLPPNTNMKVYKAKKDGSADPVGALMIYRGVSTATGGNIDVEVIDSDTHVFTYLDSKATAVDSVNQLHAFTEMLLRIQK